MSISIRCPHCNRELLLEEQYLDQEISCPGCAQGFLASSASASPAQLQYASPSGRQYYPRETCGKATAALVCGILGMTCLPMIFSILAIILGFLAKNEIKQSQGQLDGNTMATAGIVLGWLGVIIPIGALILFVLAFFGSFAELLRNL